MPILNYTTTVSIYETIGEIEGKLAKHSAKKIMKEYDNDGEIVALSFMINTPGGPQAIRLPVNVDAIQKVLIKQRTNNSKVKTDREQAARVAWRIVKDWVEAQMAILEAEMVAMDEIFMPYMLMDDQRTVYQVYTDNQLRIGDGRGIDRA